MNFVNIQVINLSENEIVNIPTEISQLKKLQQLNLKANLIQKMPNEFSEMNRLEFINLRDNDLTDEEIDRIKALLPEDVKTRF